MSDHRPEMAVPHDLQIELHDDPEAAAAFARAPYADQRDAIDWILASRCSAERAERLEETVRRLREGRRPEQG